MSDNLADIVLNQNAENATENITNTKIPSTPEGMALAYGSLVIMAILPIFFGSIRAVRHHKLKKEAGERTDCMSLKDALMFPLIASCALFGLYMFFMIFSKDYINLLLTGYFFFLGVLALSHVWSPIIAPLIPTVIPKLKLHIELKKGEDNDKEDIVNYKISTHDIVCLIISTVIGVWYLLKKHWIANNLFGLAFAINGIELLHLNNIVTGCILLSGLFVYDIFWVFGTNVMVTVAKSFDAPIKLVFPQDLLTNGFNASNFAMLGLGDIVIPGIFIALLLRIDNSLQRKSKLYFYSTMIAYLMGLLATIFVMHVFKHAQPALLYLVPACMGTPILIALIRGDIKKVFAYEDYPEEKKLEEEESKENKETEAKKSL